jgi:hypothetical protein
MKIFIKLTALLFLTTLLSTSCREFRQKPLPEHNPQNNINHHRIIPAGPTTPGRNPLASPPNPNDPPARRPSTTDPMNM